MYLDRSKDVFKNSQDNFFKQQIICPDTLNLCHTLRFDNSDSIRFLMKPTKETPVIPRNYFCNFKYNIKDKEIYKIDIFRYNSRRYSYRESIDIKVAMTPQ